ncbi:MAG: hypothetical protein ACU0BE_04780, partial [Paracoccus sp. (in: a-proteobacteria)]
MARKGPDFVTPIRRVLIALMTIVLIGLFLFWRIDSPRAERMRVALIDRFVPGFEWAFAPVTKVSQMIAGFQSYARIYEQNQELAFAPIFLFFLRAFGAVVVILVVIVVFVFFFDEVAGIVVLAFDLRAAGAARFLFEHAAAIVAVDALGAARSAA